MLRLRTLIRTYALQRGLFGGDRLWLAVGAVIVARGAIRRLSGDGTEQVVFREVLGPGEAFTVSHLPLDRKGRVPRTLRGRSHLPE